VESAEKGSADNCFHSCVGLHPISSSFTGEKSMLLNVLGQQSFCLSCITLASTVKVAGGLFSSSD